MLITEHRHDGPGFQHRFGQASRLHAGHRREHHVPHLAAVGSPQLDGAVRVGVTRLGDGPWHGKRHRFVVFAPAMVCKRRVRENGERQGVSAVARRNLCVMFDLVEWRLVHSRLAHR